MKRSFKEYGVVFHEAPRAMQRMKPMTSKARALNRKEDIPVRRPRRLIMNQSKQREAQKTVRMMKKSRPVCSLSFGWVLESYRSIFQARMPMANSPARKRIASMVCTATSSYLKNYRCILEEKFAEDKKWLQAGGE